MAPPVATERGASARELTKLEWDYPQFQVTEAPRTDGTSVKALRAALSREEALRVIAGNDPRPLLVLRECSFCNKTDDALLTPGADNEKTLIFSRWFHCVKLPVDVIAPDHPFHALFPSNEAEHLFVSSADGSGKLPLESDTSRKELWDSMAQVLKASYDAEPSGVYLEITRHLDKIDELDAKVRDLEKRKGELMETARVDPSKVQKVSVELDAVKAMVVSERTAIEDLAKLRLKSASERTAGPGRAAR